MLADTQRRGTVLVIEDEEHFRSFLKTIVQKEYTCITAGSWSEARSLLYENTIDIALVDLNLPGLSGKQIVDTLNDEFGSKIPTVVITGYEKEWKKADALQNGVAAYFKKGDFTPSALLDVLDGISGSDFTTLPARGSSINDDTILPSEKLRKIYDFTNKLISLDSLNNVVDAVINMIRKISGCTRISVMLLSDDGKYLYIKKAVGLKEDIISSTKIKVGENVAGKVFSNRRVITSDDYDVLTGKFLQHGKNGPFMSIPIIEIPYKTGTDPIGVINLTERIGAHSFTEGEKRFLVCLANSASIAIKNELRKKALEKSTIDTLVLLANVLEARDLYTQGHSLRVGSYSCETAKRLGFSGEELKRIQYAGQIHDIGKIAIPDSILLKEGRLTDEEYECMKKHPVQSKQIVDHIRFFSSIKGLFLHHHEHYDGKGYPDGISGEKIEIGARILAVADAYDAMTSNRPYRNAMSKQQAVSILIEEKGKQFDPECVEAFVDWCISTDPPDTPKQ
jgi:response regulator RpfG family c-di-GMP phosphodiesterase